MSCAVLMQVSSTFWAVTYSLPGGERATIPHFNQDIQGFHITSTTQKFAKKKACSGQIILPLKPPLVVFNLSSLSNDST